MLGMLKTSPSSGPAAASKSAAPVVGAGATAASGVAEGAASAAGGAADEVDECVICMENKGQAATLALLACKHSFCEPCLKSWTKQETSCPLCKAEFTSYKKLSQNVSLLTQSGTKRKRLPPKESTVKVAKKSQARPPTAGLGLGPIGLNNLLMHHMHHFAQLNLPPVFMEMMMANDLLGPAGFRDRGLPPPPPQQPRRQAFPSVMRQA